MASSIFNLNKTKKWVRNIIGPFLLITCCPPIVMLLWYTNVFLDGSIKNLWDLFSTQGFFSTVYAIWAPLFFGTPIAWKILAIFGGVELLLMKILPGKPFKGHLTPKGNIPVYKANGILAFITTIALFCLSAYYFKLFSPTIIYDNFGALLGALNFFSVLFCIFLYFKGRFKPSSTDSGTTGNVVFDYFWGMELYPRIFNWDIKMFTNCRFGLMSWGLILLSFAAKQTELYGLTDAMIVGVSLQLIYIFKFFFWETGYLRSMDIMHDRAGFCICWGCLVWLPCVYTSPTLYLVNHPVHLGIGTALTLFLIGASCIFINYLADRQKQFIRLTDGECSIWNKKPELIFVNYQTDWGENKQSILLASGWWGISRHFHYLPEIIATFCWSAPALFTHFAPYFYFLFLTILLVDRAYRQERRCSKKYGKEWLKYCERVPFRLIPFIY